jgi:predicted membrane channel-forming protein YqfA (hemolysin III family)
MGDPMNTTTQMLVREERRAVIPLPTTNLIGIAALSVVIAIHTTELSSKIEETSYLGFGYVLLIAASLVSIVLLAQRDRRGWLLGGSACLLTIVGFVLTRTTGLPGAMDDKGNWGETIAIWSLVAESLMVVLSGVMLRKQR